MGQVFEALMVISFGLSWPVSIRKSWVSRTAKGKSAVFQLFILFGYICGIVGKIVTNNVTYVFVFYVINAVAVSIDLCLYVRNSRLDRLREG